MVIKTTRSYTQVPMFREFLLFRSSGYYLRNSGTACRFVYRKQCFGELYEFFWTTRKMAVANSPKCRYTIYKFTLLKTLWTTLKKETARSPETLVSYGSVRGVMSKKTEIFSIILRVGSLARVFICIFFI
jgi:hypothetical protein